VTRFLIDANLPYRWDVWGGGQFQHVFDLGDDLPDRAIWEYARLNDLVIVTKDSDFSDWVMFADPPPRVIHFRTGNLRLRELKVLVDRIWPTVDDLIARNKLVIVLPNSIESIQAVSLE
jgi:predicted nuclease of predicted toxin-antitoxin system